MKLTWFGGRALRVYTGGEIVLLDPEAATGGLDAVELRSGADQVFSTLEGDALPLIDTERWMPRRARRLIDEDENTSRTEILVGRLGAGQVMVEAEGEAPLIISSQAEAEVGRWADGAVVVLCDAALARPGTALLRNSGPRLIALAGEDEAVDEAFRLLSERMMGTGLVALEHGMALEV